LKPEAQTTAADSFTDDYLLYLLAQASAAASEAFHAELARDGISVSTWRILASLYPAGRLNVGALARRCLLKQPTLTRTLDRLAEAGLICRDHSATDRRGVLVRLTDKGRRIAAENVKKARLHEARILKSYNRAEVSALKATLRQLIDNSHRP
jgi:DNA-binding MarR family transcriptional regulator